MSLQYPKVGATVKYQYNTGKFADAVVKSVVSGVCELYVGSLADVVSGVSRGHGTGKYLYYGTSGADYAKVVSISVSPTSVTGTAGGSATQLAVTATRYNGDTEVVTASATYESSNTGVATVSAGGSVTPVAAGSATVTVSYGGQSTNVPVTVS